MGHNLSDIFRFLLKLSIRKFVNAFLVWWSYSISKVTGKARHVGMPISIAIEPTTSCNLRCPECPSGLRSFTRPTGMLAFSTFHKLIDELQPTLIYLLFYFQGEPYLHPQFLDLVQYASQKGIYTATSTNAHYLDEENAKKTVKSGLDRLIISIDGTTQDTYEAYRVGGQISKVIEGTKEIVKWKKKLKSSTPHIIFQYLVVKPNEHQVEEVKKMANELGVDEVKFKTAQIYDYEKGSNLIPTIDKYSRYKKLNNGTYKIKNKLANECWKMWHSCVVTWDGKIVPCCFDKDAKYQLGDVKSHTFKEIWENEAYQKFRSSILKGRSEIDICKNCTEGLEVWA